MPAMAAGQCGLLVPLPRAPLGSMPALPLWLCERADPFAGRLARGRRAGRLEGQAQSSPKRNLHGFRRERGGCLSGDSGKPGACVRPGLGAKQGPVVGRQGWQQHAVAIVEVASPRRVELPAVRPVSEACFCMWRRQRAARDVVPVGAISPTFGDQKPSGCVRMGKAPGIVVAQMALQLRRHVRESGLDDRQ